MPWFRIDDGFADHPKVIPCSLAAIGMWAKAGAWCAKHLTDGKVPKAMVRAWGGSDRLAAELVAAGLWGVTAEGYEFHEWSTRNPTRAEVAGKRASDANRKRDERRSTPRVRADVRADAPRTPRGLAPDTPRTPTGVAADSNGSPRARARVPIPSHPGPIRGDQFLGGGGDLKASARARGSAPDPAAPGFSQNSDPDSDPDRQLVDALVAVWERVSGAPTESDQGHIREALGDVQRAAERYRERPSACFERAAGAFVADCGERSKRPVLRWLCTQFAEWALPAAAEQLSEDEKLAEARTRAAARESAEFLERCEAEYRRATDERLTNGAVAPPTSPHEASKPSQPHDQPPAHRAAREREGAATAPSSSAPPAPSTTQNYTLRSSHRALRPAHRALREARKALADAKLGRVPESELGELQQRVQHCVRAALAESTAAPDPDAPEPSEESE